MSMIEAHNVQPAPRGLEVESAIESVLGEHLRRECDDYTRVCTGHGLDVEICTLALDGFISWCEESGLPSNASALAYFMVQLHHDGADIADLEYIARAFVVRSDWDIRLPLIAALRYCEATARAIETHAPPLH
jgi:hypothetical protein